MSSFFRQFLLRALLPAVLALVLAPWQARAQTSTVNRTFSVIRSEPVTNYYLMNTAASAQLDRTKAPQLSMGVWFRLPALPTNSADKGHVLSLGGSGVGTKGLGPTELGIVIGSNAKLSLSRIFPGSATYTDLNLSSILPNTWYYLFLTVNQTALKEGSVTAILGDPTSATKPISISAPIAVPEMEAFSQASPSTIITLGAGYKTSFPTALPVADQEALFHDFSVWPVIQDAVTRFNTNKDLDNTQPAISVFLKGPGAFEALTADPSLAANQTIVNAPLLYYSTFNGTLSADKPGRAFSGDLWSTVSSSGQPDYRSVTQTFTGANVAQSISVRPTEALNAVSPLLLPLVGSSQIAKGARVSLKAPEFIYVDRDGNTLMPPTDSEVPDPDTIKNKAVARWRTLGYTVLGTSISGTNRAVDLVADQDINFQWQFQKEVALIIDSAVPKELGYSPAAGNPEPAVNKHWFAVGTGPASAPRITGAVFDPSALANDIRYRVRGYEIQGISATAASKQPVPTSTPPDDKFLRVPAGGILAGPGKIPYANDSNGQTTAFWLRAPTASAFAMDLGSFTFSQDSGSSQMTVRWLGAKPGQIQISNPRTDVWNHWCVILQNDTATVTVYLNGIPVVSGKSQKILSGSFYVTSAASALDIDALRLWDRTLTPQEVQDSMYSYNLGTGDSLSKNELVDLSFETSKGTYSTNVGDVVLTGFPGSSDNALQKGGILPADRFFFPLATANDPQVDKIVMDNYSAVRWYWSKEYKIENLTVNGSFNSALKTSSGKSGSLDGATDGGLWVADGDSVTISAKDTTTDNSTINGLVGLPTGLFENVTFANGKLNAPAGLIAAHTNGIYTLSSAFVNKAGRIIWNYGAVIRDVQITLGDSLDPATAAILNPGVSGLPDLKLSATAQAPYTVTQLVGGNPADATVANVARWDSVGRLLYPVRPGQFLISWPSTDSTTTTDPNTNKTTTTPPPYLLRVIAGFPGDTYKYDDGSVRAFGYIGANFPGWPFAHYNALYNDQPGAIDGNLNPPIPLDPDPKDRWFFQDSESATAQRPTGLAYSEKIQRTLQDLPASDLPTGTVETLGLASTRVGAGKNLQIAETSRSVLVFSARPDGEEAATGDPQREQLLVRIVESKPLSTAKSDQSKLNGGDGGVARFDGASRLEIHDISPPPSTDHCTIAFWARRDPAPNFGQQVLLDTGGDAGGGIQLGFRGAAQGGAFFFKGSGIRDITLPSVLSDTNWHHWAATFETDKTKGYSFLRLYRDGVEVIYSAVPSAADPGYAGSGVWLLGSGGNPNSAVIGGFTGLMDNFQVWDSKVRRKDFPNLMNTETPVIPTPNSTSANPRYANLIVNFTFDPAQQFDGGISGLSGDAVINAVAPSRLLLTYGADSYPEVATRITSRFDTAGMGTGFVTTPVANFNAGLYDRTAAPGAWGPVYPVNAADPARPALSRDKAGAAPPDMVYYRNDWNPAETATELRDPNVAWPYAALSYPLARFPLTGPNKDQRIYIASRIGSEGVDLTGNQQLIFDTSRYTDLKVYNQPDKTAAGYNPNEEHALIAPSIRSLIGGAPATNNPPNAVFALRDDLNLKDPAAAVYTSEPWVLAQYTDTETGEHAMMAWKVETTRLASLAPSLNIERRTDLYPQLEYGQTDFSLFLTPKTVQPSNPIYDFQYPIFAGDPLTFPYPLNVVIGASVPPETSAVSRDSRLVFWKDHKGNPWIVSGREPSPGADPLYQARFDGQFWYPLQSGFWFDLDDDGTPDKPVGTSIPWLPTNGVFYPGYRQTVTAPDPQKVRYEAFWKKDYPVLKTGETLTYAGGEYKKDHPDANGLPAVVGWAAGQVIFDTKNPMMLSIGRQSGVQTDITKTAYSARIIRPLDPRTVLLGATDLPARLSPVSNNVLVRGTKWYFSELSASLQNRVVYDTIQRTLTVQGLLNDRDISDPALTADPISLYVLDPNILSAADRDALKALGSSSDNVWKDKVEALYNMTRNPESVDLVSATGPDLATDIPGLYYPGLMPLIARDTAGNFLYDTNPQTGIRTLRQDKTQAEPLMSLGAGSALVTSPLLLDCTADDFAQPIYITVAENNHPDLGAAPVALHVIRISPERFRGGLKAILPPNPFDEKITLRHNADFGGAVEDIEYQWYASEVNGDTPEFTPEADPVVWPNQLTIGGAPVTTPTLDLIGLPERLLSDQWVYARYRKKSEGPWQPAPVALNGAPESAWMKAGPRPTDSVPNPAPAPYQWAGAANSPQIQANGSLKYIPALATGWVKRVLDRINPYEARITDFYNNSSPATYSSMIQQAGARPQGPVALNPDKNVVENVGLIALYQTVLDRALSLAQATGTSTNGIQQALLLASTRISDFYMLLGNEAYSDALDPTIGLGTGSVDYGKFAPTVWSFENQESSLLNEELGLLRGSDFTKAWPVYNRLFWNFVKGEGEAAYVNNYQISDVNHDGFINEFDAAILYPQGHGDAWGQYTSALRTQYNLFHSSFFHWLTRAEFYNLADNVLEVDYLDERKFAETAAARARAGSLIVRDTYRNAYTADPDGQWQGYTDTDPARAWGVKEWGKRAGQGAYFDWLTANSLLPAEAPDRNTGQPAENLEKLDRSTVTAPGDIVASLSEIQGVLDDATLGVTPVGVGENTVPFDIDPTFLAVGSTAQIGRRAVQGLTQFDQILERAISAVKNAITAFDYANEADNRLRQVATSTEDLTTQAQDQDLAFRNRLVALLGTPYSGTIGSGKLYPPGFAGPDLLLWPYVDRTSAQQYLPSESRAFQDILTTRGDAELSTVSESFQKLYSLPAASTNLASFFRSYLSKTFSDFEPEFGRSEVDDVPGGGSLLRVRGNGTTFALGTDLDTLFANYPLPVYTNATYGLQAPPDWGTRAVTGEIQSQVNAMTSAQIAVLKAVDDYQVYLRELTTDLDVMFAKQGIMLEQTKAGNDLLAAKKVLETGLAAIKTSKLASEAFSKKNDELANAAQTALPKVLGVASDVTSGGRAGILLAAIAANTAPDLTSDALELADQAAEFIFSVVEGNFEIYDDALGMRQDLMAAAKELQEKVNQESGLRLAIADAVNRQVQEEQTFSRLVDESTALLTERMTANQRLAAGAQRLRYNDMTLRVTRNTALQKYQDAFELAARYTYLATKAYAYDTNLADGDPANATPLLTEIVSARLPGLIEDGEPMVNGGGLASILGKLWANYSNLRGQMGINNPQFETGKFSLRHELFRVKKPDAGDTSGGAMESERRWRQVLHDRVVPNLWNVPEFRTFCVPPWAPAEGAQPALVIPFGSEIFEGKNFFGWPLGGRDQSYDASQYSTKIMGAGVWLEGYDGQNLAVAPRVWLVPAGEDVMRIPRSPDRAFRRWTVVDQTIPVPYATNQANLINDRFLPWTSSLMEPLGQQRKFSRMRAYHDDGGDSFSEDEVVNDTRLMSRSVWNTKWLLIIPGSTLSADAAAGLARLIGNDEAPGIRDIRLIFNTYSSSGN